MRFKDDLQRYLYYTSQIDFCYYCIQRISEHTGTFENPLSAMIDEATGFSKAKVLEAKKGVIYYVNCIIRCKKKLGYTVDNDRKFLSEIKKLK